MKSQEIALCGLLSALAVCALILGGVIPAAVLCGPMLAMLVLLPLREEYGVRTAGAAYAAVSILGGLLTPDPETALVFWTFGWYPLLQPSIDRVRTKALRLVFRLLACNAAIAALYWVGLHLLGLADLTVSAVWLEVLFWVWANGLFLLNDKLLHRFAALWRHKLRRRLLHK